MSEKTGFGGESITKMAMRSENRRQMLSSEQIDNLCEDPAEKLYKKLRSVASTGKKVDDNRIIKKEILVELSRRDLNSKFESKESEIVTFGCLEKWPTFLQNECSYLLLAVLSKLRPSALFLFEPLMKEGSNKCETCKSQGSTECPGFKGHESYVTNMISGASQADFGILVISALKGEFEIGYEKGGQTREHVLLAKTLALWGVPELLVVVNKMDDPTVNWSEERYDEIQSKMVPFLEASGYNVENDVRFLPISFLVGSNMNTRVDKITCPWWNGPCLSEVLDAVEVPTRDPNGPFRLPIIGKLKELGTVVMGKVESGSVRKGDLLIVMPKRVNVKVVALYVDEKEVTHAKPGENLRVKLSGIEEKDILSGFVLSSVSKPIVAVNEFIAQLQILELLDNAIFAAGCKAVLHVRSVVEECEIVELMHQTDMKTGKPIEERVLFVNNNAAVVCRIQVNNVICVEKFSDFPQLGRFSLRTKGGTVAVGKITELRGNNA